ncbi:MAG: hypothetical protein JXR91_00095 [Deltaproteobacteria bacterium]|nr:hypothetical protein [Deltaproteobacteria bacterium]
MTFKNFHILIPSIILALALASCQEDVKDVELAQFNKPKNVTLVCYDSNQGALPLKSCANTERTDAQIYAFVTQTEYGEVAVVNLEDYKVTDQDIQIPFNSFIPVGGQPTDIATSHDGKSVFTANYETMDISKIDVQSSLLTPSITAAESISLTAAPAKLVIASDTGTNQNIADKYAFVTQPSQGRIAVVNLEESKITVNGKSVNLPKGPIAFLRLDGELLTNVKDERVEGISPYAIIASSKNASIYVGGTKSARGDNSGGNYIAEIHSGAFIEKAVESYSINNKAAFITSEQVIVRIMSLGDFTSKDMSIEPELERWIYIIENEKQGVIVLDLISGKLLEVNNWNPKATDLYSIDIPGIPKSIEMVRLSDPLTEGEYPDPYNFNGSFAIVSTTQKAIFVIDAEIDPAFASQIENFTPYTHSLHSKNLWYDTNVDDGEDAIPLYPELTDQPSIYVNEEQITFKDDIFQQLEDSTDFTQTEDWCKDNPQGFRMLESDYNYNTYFRCDRRVSTSEDWALTYEGFAGISGVGILKDVTDSTAVFTDEYKDFCSAGLLGPAGDDLWGQFPEGTDSKYFEGFRNYGGDLIELTGSPTPINPETDCSQFEDEDIKYMYRVSKIVDSSTITIKALKSTGDVKYGPLPTRECFGQAFTYEVRANDSYIFTGHSSGRITEGSMINNKCVPWSGDPANFSNRIDRVFEDVPFQNSYLKFQLNKIDDLGNGLTKQSADSFYITFTATNGFSPLYSVQGSNITDIKIAPNNDLVLIDQSYEGLVLFDMINTFSKITDSIN